LTLWRDVDGSSAEVPLAEVVLGTALLRQGQSGAETDPARACAGLEAAMDALSKAGEALRAFGAEYAADVALCEEQIDFARRLREGMEGEDSGLGD